jgi:peptidoglycan hydrolase-like protein with peptidoglycan-binding domain
MTVESEALALVQSLERASRRTRPFLMYGLVAVLIGFGALIYNLEEQRRAAEQRAVAAETLVRTLREAQRSGGSPEVLSRALSQAEDLSSSLSEGEGIEPELQLERREPAAVTPPVRPAAPPAQPAAESVAPPSDTESVRREQIDAAQEVQRLLAAAGYDAGPADGVVGARTKALIRRYQRERGLNESGEADEATLRSLRSPQGSAAVAQRTAMRAATMEAQRLLKRIDYDVGEIDGFAGAKTRAAIGAYQREHGLAASGVADPPTLKSLKETAETYGARPPVPAEAAPSTAEAQELLKKLGYPIRRVDGQLGMLTQILIRSFQKDNGLPDTGTLDAATMRALRSKAAAAAPAPDASR